MEDKDIYILAEEANTYDTPNRSIEAGIFTDAFIKGYKKANEWISTSDVLPEAGKDVMVYHLEEKEFVAYLLKNGKHVIYEFMDYSYNTYKLEEITHWKALPTKP